MFHNTTSPMTMNTNLSERKNLAFGKIVEQTKFQEGNKVMVILFDKKEQKSRVGLFPRGMNTTKIKVGEEWQVEVTADKGKYLAVKPFRVVVPHQEISDEISNGIPLFATVVDDGHERRLGVRVAIINGYTVVNFIEYVDGKFKTAVDKNGKKIYTILPVRTYRRMFKREASEYAENAIKFVSEMLANKVEVSALARKG